MLTEKYVLFGNKNCCAVVVSLSKVKMSEFFPDQEEVGCLDHKVPEA